MARTKKDSARNPDTVNREGDHTLFDVAAEQVLMIPINRIRTRPGFNPRKKFEEPELQELAESIKLLGVLQPITVRHVTESVTAPAGATYNHWYEIVMGERRYRASIIAGKEQIPAIISPGLDDDTHLELALIENLLRVDLDPFEEAEGYQRLIDRGYSQKRLAERVKRPQSSIANALFLLRLPEDVQGWIRKGTLTIAHGKALAKVVDFPKVASAIAKIAMEYGWNSRTLEQGSGLANVRDTTLVRSLVRAEFDTKVCLKCPFKAYRKDGNGFCLKPEHYLELEKEAKHIAEEERKALEANPAARKIKKSTIVDLSKLDYRAYERLTYNNKNVPGCSKDCVCYAKGRLYAGDAAIPVCLDPKRLRGLKSAASRAAKKVRREQVGDKRQVLQDLIDDIAEIGSREMAVLVRMAMFKQTKAAVRQKVAAAMGLALPDEWHDYDNKKFEVYNALAALDPVTLMRYMVACEVETFLESHVDFDSATLESNMRWYLNVDPKGIPIVSADPASEIPGAVETADDPDALPPLQCRSCGKVDPDPMNSQWLEEDLCLDCDPNHNDVIECRNCGTAFDPNDDPLNAWLVPDLCNSCNPEAEENITIDAVTATEAEPIES